MDMAALTEGVKKEALSSGAALAGIVEAASLPEHAERIETLLPGGASVLVLAVPHSQAALKSKVNQAAQYDTMRTYDECQRTAGAASRWLEARGYPALAVPAFIPLDMSDAKKGMRGEICWRRAGVRAGLGVYGESGLLVTAEYGSAVRLVGVVTTAPLLPDAPLDKDLCDHCGRCLKVCPVAALAGEGRINKRLCGDNIFRFGYRYFESFVRGLESSGGSEGGAIPASELRELWQTLMTGNYYYCFACQTQCPSSLSRRSAGQAACRPTGQR